MSSSKSVQIVPGRLYWISDVSPPKSRTSAFYFNIDDQLVYYGFDQDFGPLNLAQTHRFCSELQALFNRGITTKDKQYHGYKIYHYTSTDFKKRANAAYLMCAFQIIILGRTAEESFKPFETVRPPFVAFRDASQGPCYYKCSIFHCIKGLECAIKLKWYNFKTFNLSEYEHYEVVDNGDLNWIVPGKFMAFSGPASNQYDMDNNRTFTPEDYAPIFKKFGVSTVVRLNKKQYDRERFLKKGVKHHDLYFIDGSTPKDDIVYKWLDIAENTSGGIAIHCKAGLGRTGTLIALYCMKHFRVPAPYFIGWIRVCRPGSILGPQQHYLLEMEERMFKEGDLFRKTRADSLQADFQVQLDLGTSPSPGSGATSPYDRSLGSMSPADSHKAKYGDLGQADKLNSAKREKFSTPSPSGSPGSIASPGTGALSSKLYGGAGSPSKGAPISGASPAKGKAYPATGYYKK